MLLVAVVSASRSAGRLIARHGPLAVGLGALALYAPSNRCWFGERLVWDYAIPLPLMPLVENARATGRFFWPVTYALMVAVCALVVRRFGRAGTVIVSLAALVQLADATACWRIVSNALASPAKRELDWSVWTPALAGASPAHHQRATSHQARAAGR